MGAPAALPRGARRAGARVAVLGSPPEGVAAAGLERLLRAALRELRVDDGEVALRFAGDGALRRYNRRFRGVDRATDVLSFPAGDGMRSGGHLGDILVSRDRARVQAARSGLPLRREVEELALHGLLHLLGHDHETDGGEMDALELDLRRRLLDRKGPGRG